MFSIAWKDFLDFLYETIDTELLEELQALVLAYKYKKSSTECQRYLKVKLIYFMRKIGSENYVDLYYARESFHFLKSFKEFSL